jgi:hypothetical protein
LWASGEDDDFRRKSGKEKKLCLKAKFDDDDDEEEDDDVEDEEFEAVEMHVLPQNNCASALKVNGDGPFVFSLPSMILISLMVSCRILVK